jgi:YidC/Oxa1 family membrane protein insertase
MEKRLIIFIVLAVAVLLAWQWIFPPPEPPPAPPPAEITEQAPAAETPALTDAREGEGGDPVEAVSTVEPADPVEATLAEQIVVEADRMRVVLTNRGGRIVSWRLNDKTTREGTPIEIVPPYASEEGKLPLEIDLDDDGLEDVINGALFVVERETLTGGERVTFRWADGRGVEVTKSLDFRGQDYTVALEVDVIDRGRRLPARVAWGPGFRTSEAEAGLRSYYYYNQFAVNVAGSVDREKELEETMGLAERQVRWAGIEDQYFAALFVPLVPLSDLRAWPMPVVPPPDPESTEAPAPIVVPVVSVSVPEEGILVFGGPKNYRMLKEMGHDLGKAVWFSSVALFAWMARILYAALIWIYTNMVQNYGVAIIMTTLALRIVLFPLNQFSMVRMKKMQTEMARIQPKINAIKKKHSKKKDAESRVKMNNELMALYKEEGVNPMGGVSGCLPLLAQFPILIGFYDMLLAAEELRQAPFFGWIQDLTLKDPFYITPILMGVTMFAQQKMTQAKIGDPTQQRIMMMMPLIFTIMFLNLPSGLVLYWFVNNLLGIGQQWLVNRHLQRVEERAAKKA